MAAYIMVSCPDEKLIEFSPMLFCHSSQNGSFPKLLCWNGLPGKLIGTILRRSGVQGWIPLNAPSLARTNVRALPLATNRRHFLAPYTSTSTSCATPAACIWPVARGRGASLARSRGLTLATGGAFRSSHQLATSNGSKRTRGFRKKQSTAQAIHIIRRIIDIGERANEELHLVLLDLEKAFDKVSQKGLLIALERM